MVATWFALVIASHLVGLQRDISKAPLGTRESPHIITVYLGRAQQPPWDIDGSKNPGLRGCSKYGTKQYAGQMHFQ